MTETFVMCSVYRDAGLISESSSRTIMSKNISHQHNLNAKLLYRFQVVYLTALCIHGINSI